MLDLFIVLWLGFALSGIVAAAIHLAVQDDVKKGVVDVKASVIIGYIKYICLMLSLVSMCIVIQHKTIEPLPVKLYILEDANGIKHSYINSRVNQDLVCVDYLGQLTSETKVGLVQASHPWFGVSTSDNVVILNDK